MLASLMATAAAFGFGVANYLGGVASRRDSALAVTANAHLLGVALMTLAVLAVPASGATLTDIALGALAGLTGGSALVALYAALAVGRMGVVAPLTAAVSAALPALYDVMSGTALRPLTALGIVLALTAVVVVSVGGEDQVRTGRPSLAVFLSVAAGIGFSFTLLTLSFTGEGSGFLPLLSGRIVSALLLGLLATVRTGRYAVDVGARRPAYGSGLFDSLANIVLLVAIRSGPLAVVAVLSALHPVVTMLLARVFLGERLRNVQRVGVTVALVAVVLTALP